MAMNNCPYCQQCSCCGRFRAVPMDPLPGLEQIEKLNEERRRGILFVDRISQCGSPSVIRFCLGVDQIR